MTAGGLAGQAGCVRRRGRALGQVARLVEVELAVPDPQDERLPFGLWYAGLPTLFGSAAALLTDPTGRVLLVKPNYREYRSLPGGILEHSEPPHAGGRREVAEELGLDIAPGLLLAIDWSPPDGVRPRPIGISSSTAASPTSTCPSERRWSGVSLLLANGAIRRATLRTEHSRCWGD